MAKTYKAKKPQRYQAIGYRPSKRLVVILAILISVGLVGSVLVSAIFGMSNIVGSSNGPSATQIDDYRKALENDTSDINTRINLGHSLFDRANSLSQEKNKEEEAAKLYGEAEAEYKKVLEKQPNNPEVAGNLAIVYFYTNRVDLAMETAEKSLEANPNYYTTRMNYGIFLGFGKQNYVGAIKELEKIPNSAPEYTRAQDLIKQFNAELSKPTLPNPNTSQIPNNNK